ncbi:hypothetical protein BG015_002873 [Linnemannia schmuckeri]|uniref:Transmembrane protein n=1 Tax=Linnemannia schmuckeri TaxID=64567 RepID=A0A9P5VFM1_9FUNG|nr:hypothetical protein BG015_002873 [Linnemannia schmuckeri]
MSPTLSSSPSSTFSSSETPSSTATLITPFSKQRRVTRATIFLITLTLTCCLLSSTTSFAAPVAKPQSKHLLRQRSLANQVHHVQVADESVHNTVLLLKKSIQKRKSQKRQQPPQQQQGHTAAKISATKGEKEKRTKRHAKREIVDSSFLSASVPEDHTATNNNDVRVEGLVDLASIVTTEVHSSTTHDGNNSNAMIEQSRKMKAQVQRKKKLSGGHHRTKLLSAYESIIFSESQIPVFLTQAHHHQRLLRPQHRRQLKGAKKSNNNAERHHQNPIRADSIPPVFFSSSGDDVAMAQADPPSPSSLDSGLEQQQHATTTIVAQDSADTASASNNNNLQIDHVADEIIALEGVTDDQPSENNDKNSSLLAASPVLQSQEEEDASFSIAIEEGGSEPFSSSSSFSSAGRIEAVALGDESSQGADSPTGEEVAKETAAVVIAEDESSSTTDENEDGWVTITSDDLVSDSSNTIDVNLSLSSSFSSVEFQSPDESDDIPFSDDTPIHHHQRTTGTSLFHSGCSSSSVITFLGGLLLTVIGLAYRLHIRRQQQKKQQARRLGSSLPLDAKASLSTKSEGKSSAHRLSVDSISGLKREGDSARTTAMRDYVGFNM